MDTSNQIKIETDDRMIVHSFCLDENGTVIVSGEKVEDIIKEKEYWHRQALTYAAQLGEIRIWIAQLCCTSEKVLEDCKTMFPK